MCEIICGCIYHKEYTAPSADWMLPNCPVACEDCDVGCADLNENCAAWKDLGECEENKVGWQHLKIPR